VVGSVFVLTGVVGVGLAVVGAVGTHGFLTDGQELTNPVGVGIGIISLIAGTTGVWAIVRGVRIFQGRGNVPSFRNSHSDLFASSPWTPIVTLSF